MSFLEKTFDYIQKIDSRPHDWIFILPSTRSIKVFQKNWDNSDSNFILPSFHTPNTFVEQFSTLVPISKIETTMYFLEFLHFSNYDTSLRDICYKRIEEIIELFTEIDAYILDEEKKKSFFEKHCDIEEVENFGEIKKNFFLFWQKIESVYNDFKEFLTKNNIAYSSLLYVDFIKNFEEISLNLKNKKIALVGLYAFSEIEELLWKTFQDSKNVEFYFFADIDQYYTETIKNHEVSFFIKKYKENNLHFIDINNCNFNEKKIEITKHELNISSEQAPLLSNMISQINPKEKTAIILGDLNFMKILTHWIPKSENINIATGFPLNNNNLISHIIAWEDEKTLSNFEKVISYFKIDFSDFKEKYHTSKNYFIESIESILADNSKYPIDETETFILYNLKSISTKLNQFELTDECSCKMKSKFIKEHLKQLNLYYEGDQNSPIQILGTLESRALDFDNIIYLSFTDNLYPGAFQYKSLVKFSLRKEFKLPLPAEKEALYAYNFYRLFHKSKKITLLYAIDSNNSQISRYYTQIYYERKKLPNFIFQEETNVPTINNLTLSKPISTDKNYYHEKLLKKFENGISVSFLKEFYRDKFSFFQKYILDLKATNTSNINLEFGNIIHDIIFLLLKKYKNEILDSKLFSKIKSEIQNTINTYLDENSSKYDISIEIITPYIINTIKNFLKKISLNFPINEKNIILDLENYYERTCSFEIELINNETTHKVSPKLQGKVDLLLKKDEQITIIDYKTNKSGLNIKNDLNDIENTILFSKHSNDFQLDFYQYMISGHFQEITAYEKQIISLNPKVAQKSYPNDTKFIEDFEILLKSILNEIWEFDFNFNA